MTLDASHLRAIAQGIWGSLGLELEELGSQPRAVAGPAEVTGFVLIHGDWKGVVAIQCSELGARHLAGTMFGVPPDELDEGEVADAVGELANMVGGNLKSLVPGSCELSLPAVVTGRTTGIRVAQCQPLLELKFLSGGDEVQVTVLKSEEVQ